MKGSWDEVGKSWDENRIPNQLINHAMLNTTIGDKRVIRTILNPRHVIDETA